MADSTLTNLSPLDGRYRRQTDALRNILSEFGLIRYRVLVEVSWFRQLSAAPDIGELPALSASASQHLERALCDFGETDAAAVKLLERDTNHDVKAVEYWVKARLREHPELAPHIEFVHFGCTSEDINNLAYALMLREAREVVLQPALQAVEDDLRTLAGTLAEHAMVARTHGQTATPTTLGKEFNVFAARLARQRKVFAEVPTLGKLNGAVGNFNAHVVAYPKVDWLTVSRTFVESLGLTWNPLTTQIEPHDWIAEYLHALVRINQIVLDLVRDAWGYVSLDYLRQRKVVGETGSSTMPHKINPIDFENAEGNLGIATALLEHLAQKLPVSRWQRDLSDSTALRNLGPALGHALLAYDSARRGLAKVEANKVTMRQDLDEAWEVLGEAVQTVMRRYGMAEPYEQLKTLTRGARMDARSYRKLVEQLALPEAIEAELLELLPRDYLGIAPALARWHE